MKPGLRNLGANKTQLTFDNGLQLFYSYATPVASYSPITCEYYRTEKRYSNTTTKHINQWLEGCEAIEKPQSYFDNLEPKPQPKRKPKKTQKKTG